MQNVLKQLFAVLKFYIML